MLSKVAKRSINLTRGPHIALTTIMTNHKPLKRQFKTQIHDGG